MKSLDGSTPTGSVTYLLYAGTGCAGRIDRTDSVPLSGEPAPASTATGRLPAGSYSYEAEYSGDGNHSGSVSACQAFTVRKAASTLSGTVYDAATHKPWGRTEPAGTAAYDAARVAGVTGLEPTRTITYSFYVGTSCAAKPRSVDRVTLSKGSVPSSLATGKLPAGKYAYQAAYSGDPNYVPSKSSCVVFTV